MLERGAIGAVITRKRRRERRREVPAWMRLLEERKDREVACLEVAIVKEGGASRGSRL